MKYITAFLLLVSIQARTEITLPKILGNNMVLQRNQPVPVWGSALVGEQVTVDFNKQHKVAITGTSGKWKIILDPMPASDAELEMKITGTNIIQLHGILIGEVWLCSGQSNMEYTMRKNSKVIQADSGAGSPIHELDRAKNPAIRIFLVTNKNLRLPDPTHSGWSIAKDSALRSFSAAAYFFAKELYHKLRIPIGVISSAVPGSAIEPWLPATIINNQQLNTGEQPLKLNASDPGKFYPIMVEPLSPFAIKGFLWYQGETNCFQNEKLEYTYKMQVLIEGWRKLWNNSNLPFYYVQIAPFYYSKSAGKYPLTVETLPEFWEAQELAQQIQNTAMITITDLVDTPNDLHPGFKWEVGRRLALLALAKKYHAKIVCSGPVYKQMKILQNKIELSFDDEGGGLVSKNGKSLTSFTIANANGKFVPANAIIKGNKIIVSSSAVPEPLNVRFEWDEGGKANLYNKEGLPAVPFRTDNPNHFKPGNITYQK